MNISRKVNPIFAATFGLALACVSLRAGETFVPDLKAIPAGKGWNGATDVAKLVEKDGEPAVEVTGHAVMWLDGYMFSNGVIEFDAKGKSGPPQSNFMGISFRVVDGNTYNTVWHFLAPFNTSGRRTPSVNRTPFNTPPEPDWPWHRLRNEQTGLYEKPIAAAPDGDAQWFHARVVVEKPQVSVFVNGADKPSLVVDELTERKGGSVGLFFDGYGIIANLKITPAP